MKNKSLISMFALAAVLFASCKTELEPQPSSEVTTTETEAVAPADAEEIAPTPTEAESATAVTPQQATQTVQMPAAAQPAATAPGMNPPHGQPGHRCDIAVGAPLNSPKAAAPAATPQAGTSTITKVQPQNTGSVPSMLAQPAADAATSTPPGMNPPHGQPGHSCSVAVGAPLPK
jgi:hypothetical protein